MLHDILLVDLSKSDFVEAKDIPPFWTSVFIEKTKLKKAAASKPVFIYACYLKSRHLFATLALERAKVRFRQDKKISDNKFYFIIWTCWAMSGVGVGGDF